MGQKDQRSPFSVNRRRRQQVTDKNGQTERRRAARQTRRRRLASKKNGRKEKQDFLPVYRTEKKPRCSDPSAVAQKEFKLAAHCAGRLPSSTPALPLPRA